MGPILGRESGYPVAGNNTSGIRTANNSPGWEFWFSPFLNSIPAGNAGCLDENQGSIDQARRIQLPGKIGKEALLALP